MNESTENQDRANAASDAASLELGTEDKSALTEFRQLKTMPGHTGFTLVGFAFLVFEILFVSMYSDKFWFGVDIRWLGIPAVAVAIVVAHFLLRWQESANACNFFAPIWQQKPPMVYSQWLRFNDPLFAPGIRFGNRHITWDAIDELHLSMWGNLIVKSRKLSGPARDLADKSSRVDRAITQPDVVLKFPFAIASPEDQRLLVETVEALQPYVVLNDRLRTAVSSVVADSSKAEQIQKISQEKLRQGTVIVSIFGALFLLLVLFDVGHSSFNYLQALKGYYLCQVDATEGNLSKAQIDYNSAEDIRLHPLPFSWVTTKLMTQEPVGPALYQAKAEALWSMGKEEQAIEAAKQALALAPKGFRHNLRLARMLTAVGRTKEAAEQISKAIENHKGNFLSALYMVALEQGSPPDIKSSAKSAYDQYKAAIDDEVFAASGPQWPPGGERFLHDIWYKDDVEYVFDRLIGPQKPKK